MKIGEVVVVKLSMCTKTYQFSLNLNEKQQSFFNDIFNGDH